MLLTFLSSKNRKSLTTDFALCNKEYHSQIAQKFFTRMTGSRDGGMPTDLVFALKNRLNAEQSTCKIPPETPNRYKITK